MSWVTASDRSGSVIGSPSSSGFPRVGDARHGGPPASAVWFVPGDRVAASVVEDDLEGLVAQRQVGDQLGEALPQRLMVEDLLEAGLAGLAQRGPHSGAQRRGVHIDPL